MKQAERGISTEAIMPSSCEGIERLDDFQSLIPEETQPQGTWGGNAISDATLQQLDSNADIVTNNMEPGDGKLKNLSFSPAETLTVALQHDGYQPDKILPWDAPTAHLPPLQQKISIDNKFCVKHADSQCGFFPDAFVHTVRPCASRPLESGAATIGLGMELVKARAGPNQRLKWGIGSLVEVYSVSASRWHAGYITDVALFSSGQDVLTVQFFSGDGFKQKSLYRNDCQLAPYGSHVNAATPALMVPEMQLGWTAPVVLDQNVTGNVKSLANSVLSDSSFPPMHPKATLTLSMSQLQVGTASARKCLDVATHECRDCKNLLPPQFGESKDMCLNGGLTALSVPVAPTWAPGNM